MAFEYAKVILYAYPHMAALAEATGQSAENCALLSFRSAESTLALAERIAETLAVKSRLLALKEAADRAVDACTEEERFLLEYKYFRRRKELRGRFSGAEVSCSERNYFRRQAALLRKMVSELGRRGWTERAFLEAFGAFAPFMRAFRALSEGQEGKLVAHRGKRDIRFRTEVRSRKVRS